MSENSSSVSSSFHPQLLPLSFLLAEDLSCFISRPSSFLYVSFYLTNFFLMFPLILLILSSALRERQQKRTSTTSHFDCFTYNIVIMELFGVLRCVPYCYGIYTENVILIFVGGFLSSFIWYGETSLHVLTCVERYLAVVHPLIYLGLRNDRGVRIRNVSVCCAWLFCFIRLGIFVMKEVFIIMDFCLLVLSLLIMAFCSLSVLSVLIRPGPGERLDPSKHRAFYTIVSILGVLTLRFLASLSWTVMFVSRTDRDCLLMACVIWLNVPTSLMLPLLFLHRAGTFRCCKNCFQ